MYIAVLAPLGTPVYVGISCFVWPSANEVRTCTVHTVQYMCLYMYVYFW